MSPMSISVIGGVELTTQVIREELRSLRRIPSQIESCAPRTELRSCRVSTWFFFSSRRRHTRLQGDWSSDVCSSDLTTALGRALGLPPLGACFFGSFVSDFGDKAVTFALVTSVLHALPRRTAARFPLALRAIGAA